MGTGTVFWYLSEIASTHTNTHTHTHRERERERERETDRHHIDNKRTFYPTCPWVLPFHRCYASQSYNKPLAYLYPFHNPVDVQNCPFKVYKPSCKYEKVDFC